MIPIKHIQMKFHRMQINLRSGSICWEIDKLPSKQHDKFMRTPHCRKHTMCTSNFSLYSSTTQVEHMSVTKKDNRIQGDEQQKLQW